MKRRYAGMEYEEVVRALADNITRLCVVRTQDTEAAKDCFQNTFLKLYQTKREFRDMEHIKAWLICVARNECNDYHRAFWRRNVDLGYIPEDDKETIFYGDNETERLVTALHKIGAKYREILYLYYYEEYDTNEIAKMLHISVNTVKSRLRRGRTALAGIMQEDEKENGGRYGF